MLSIMRKKKSGLHIKLVALKFLSKKKLQGSEDDERNLQREVDNLKVFNGDPLFMFLQEVLDHETCKIIVTDYIIGLDLLEFRQHEFKKIVKEKEAALIIQKVAQATLHMHEKGIKHRDMHCRNIMLDFQDLYPNQEELQKVLKKPKKFYRDLQQRKLNKLKGFTSPDDFNIKIIDMGYSK